MKIKTKKYTDVYVEVDLPIYRSHDLGSCTSLMRVMQGRNGKLTEHTITLSNNHRSVELEVDDDYKFDNSSADYLLEKDQ